MYYDLNCQLYLIEVTVFVSAFCLEFCSCFKKIHNLHTMHNFLKLSTLIVFLTAQDPYNCYKKKGATVISMKVMLDEGALLGFNSIDPKGFQNIFHEIFDKINKDLQKYGAQFHLDFSSTSTAGFIYDKLKCLEPNPAQNRSSIAMKALKLQGDVGNRLIIFFCPNLPNSPLTGSVSDGDCNNVIGFLAGNPKSLASSIEKKVVDVVFGTTDRESHFNDNICSKSNKCTETVWGDYVPDLKAVRHIGNDNNIMVEGDELGEHDLYDDMFLHDYIGKKHKLKKVKKESKINL